MAAAVAAVSMVSCDNDDSKPTIEFSKTLYTVYQKGDVDVDVVVSGPAETDLTVPLTFIGNAEKGVDYTASAESVVIKAGESSGSVTITNVSLSEEKQVSLGFTVPEGYSMGTKIVAVIAPSSQEALVYSFNMTKFDALEGCLATVNVVGTLTGKDFKADEDIYVPLAVSGEGASKLSFTDEGTTYSTSSVSAKPGVFALIHAGESSGVAKFKVEDGFSGDLKAEISVNEEADSRFIAGDNSKMEVAVKGLQTPDKLVGTWKFSKVFSKDEMDMWFMEYEDDPEALRFTRQCLEADQRGARKIKEVTDDGGVVSAYYQLPGKDPDVNRFVLFKVNSKGTITLVYIEGELDSDDLITLLFTKKDL